jgi:translocation and assembly module TamB
MRIAHLDRRSVLRGARRVAAVAARVALCTVAIVALIVGASWTLLQTRRGSEALRRFALPRVNAMLAGSVAVERLAFAGNRLTFDGVALRDPEGNVVARADQIDVKFALLPLVRRRVAVRELTIRRPELALIEDARGLNIARALAPRQPRPTPPAAGPPKGDDGGMTIDLRALAITGGVVDFRSQLPGAERHVHVDDIGVRAALGLAGARFTGDASVTARGGRLDVSGTLDTAAKRGHASLRALLPGTQLTAAGGVDGEDVRATVTVDATDLAATARSLRPSDREPPAPIAGSGRAHVVLAGTRTAPSLRLTTRFPSLRVGDARVQQLAASVVVPDLRFPEAIEADVSAPSAAIGDRVLRSLSASVRATGERLRARAAIAAPYPLHVDVAGRRHPGRGRMMSVDALTIRYPEATWSLVRPARISLGAAPGVTGLALRADRQRVALEAGGADRQRRAHVEVSRFDLGRLPRALVPPSLGLAGIVDADVTVRAGGNGAAAPNIDAKASLTGGRLRGYRNLSLALTATVAGGRARGTLEARGLSTAVAARFDVPSDMDRLRGGRSPLRLDVDVADVDFAKLAAAIAETTGKPIAVRVQGRARLSLRLGGNAQRPRLTIAAAARSLRVDEHAVGDLALEITGDGGRPLAARITSAAPTHARVEVTMPLSLSTLVRKPPTGAAVMRTPFEIRGDVDRLPLVALARIGGYPDPVGGTLSSHLELRGPAASPEGTVTFDVAGATSGRFPATDARIELDFQRRACEARVRVTRKARPLLALTARLELPVTAASDPGALAAAPVRVRAVIGPLAMQRLGLPPTTDRDPPRAFNGRLHADVSVDGTLRAPRAVVHVQVDDVRLDKSFVGYARLEASYADQKAKLDARLTTQNGGTLHVAAASKLDLGYPAVTRRLDARRLPLDVRIDAQRFDLRGFSGATQELRTVAGLLTASATVGGTVADPKLAGRVDWSEGVVAVTGFGQYERIHLALRGDANGVVVDELVASSGGGKARVQGDGKRTPGKGYEIALQANLDRFPIYKQGQPLANVSLESKLKGRVAPFDTRIALEIGDARVQLAEADRKRLQPLEVPADIVLVEGDKPLNRAQEKKLRALTGVAGGDGHAPDKPSAPAATLRMKVNAPRRLWVSGKDANLELGLAPDFRVHVDDRTRVFGQVIVHRGRIDVFGRRFDLKPDSTLTWSGEPDRPQVDVRAEHVNEKENVTVLLTARGGLDKLTVTVSSPNRPELTESQLYTLLLTGRLQLGAGTSGSSSASSQAASMLGGLVASQLQKTLRNKLPLDVLSIDAGNDGVRGTRLEAGRYVTDKLYVGYVGRVGADPTRYQNRNAVHLEYHLTSRWEIEAEYGDVGTGTADLMWKKNY